MMRTLRGVAILLGAAGAGLVPPAFAASPSEGVCALFPQTGLSATTNEIALAVKRKSLNSHVLLFNPTDENQIKQLIDSCSKSNVDAILITGINLINPNFVLSNPGYDGPFIVFDTKHPTASLIQLDDLLLGDNLSKIKASTVVLSPSAVRRVSEAKPVSIQAIMGQYKPDEVPGSSKCPTSCSYNVNKDCCETSENKCDCQ